MPRSIRDVFSIGIGRALVNLLKAKTNWLYFSITTWHAAEPVVWVLVSETIDSDIRVVAR